MVAKLNGPASTQQPSLYVRPNPAPYDEPVVRVHFLRTEAQEGRLDLATMLRPMTDMYKMFVNASPAALTFSGSAEKVALADWLLDELDRPVNDQGAAQPRKNPAPYSFRERGDESVVRVPYPIPTAADRLDEMAALLHTSTGISRAFVYRPAGALVFRCKPDQVELAEKLIAEQDKL